jgi:chemotaxis protein MotB
MAEVAPEKKESAGVPAWVMTFADLMTLLMCFFVLLLAFSEMDIAKFKQLSGSMKDAFGVQAEVEVRTIPKGTSVIAQEFSPGKPEQTPMNEVRQFTINSIMESFIVSG